MTSEGPLVTRTELRLLRASGLLLWLLGALTGIWEGLALQSPVSPLHLGVLAGPIAQLRLACFGFGTGALVLGPCWPTLYAERRGRAVLGLLVLGAGGQLLSLAYAAAFGLLAVQLNDPRADARAVVYVRFAAQLLTAAALAALGARALSRRGSASSLS